ncbi:MAG: hypothetical protein ABMA15_05395 [Vicinamibacterales bacterium]
MRPFFHSAAVALVVCSTVACGSSNQQNAADELQKSAEQTQKGADAATQGAQDMAKGFEAMAKGLAAAAGGGADGVKPVDPVSFRELQTVMPEISGWERKSPTGERMTAPFAFSQSSTTYTNGDSNVELKIMDSGFNQMLFAPFAMFMAAGYEKETQDGFEKSVTIGGYPGFEKWDKGTKNGELTVVVNKRFLVQVEGHDVADEKVLHNILDKTDLAKLASLK